VPSSDVPNWALTLAVVIPSAVAIFLALSNRRLRSENRLLRSDHRTWMTRALVAERALDNAGLKKP
jgi:hypothetical protein